MVDKDSRNVNGWAKDSSNVRSRFYHKFNEAKSLELKTGSSFNHIYKAANMELDSLSETKVTRESSHGNGMPTPYRLQLLFVFTLKCPSTYLDLVTVIKFSNKLSLTLKTKKCVVYFHTVQIKYPASFSNVIMLKV
eukprot:TRINITY_DN20036_c3_g1_i1.p1 TRINITY_DN20036_c3_g1~~TRINITY_DN20036_c3_g1_i1.p1  ORF type:complete len:136 (-),score=11.40 TRINITY_DN20036_c3_g1_i1:769-1176(-)